MKKIFTADKILTLVSVALAVGYTSFFLWSVSRSSADPIVDKGSAGGPQVVVIVFLIGAALSLLLWRDWGRILALAFFVGVLGKFAFWATSTTRIKTNAGVGAVPDASWIGNIWIGAGKVELIVFTLTLFLLVAHLLREIHSRRTLDEDSRFEVAPSH